MARNFHIGWYPELFECDIKAREKVLEILSECNELKVDDYKKYGQDMKVSRGDRIVGFLELEVVKGWTTEEYPFRSRHMSIRKDKWVGTNTAWIIFSNDLSQHVGISLDKCVNYPIIEIHNKLSFGELEKFYDVPKDIFVENYLEKLKKRENHNGKETR